MMVQDTILHVALWLLDVSKPLQAGEDLDRS